MSVHDFDRYEDSGVNWRVVRRLRNGHRRARCRHAGQARLPGAEDRSKRQASFGGDRRTASITADAAIVTLPSNLLAEEKLLFTPALPDKAEAAAGLPLGLADKLFLSLSGAEEFDKDSRLFGRTDRTATGAYHFRPFGRPMIEGYFGGRLAAELEAGGDGSVPRLRGSRAHRPPRQRFRSPAEAARALFLGNRPLRPRLLFICPARQGRLPGGARRAGGRSPVLRGRGLLA